VTSAIRTAIAAIPEDAWTAIAYPQAIWDECAMKRTAI
jgi:hypothetical protein